VGSQTRWIEQADALIVFQEMYDAVIEALNNISQECDNTTSSAASQLLAAITGFPFLVSLVTASSLLNYTKPVSVVLQKSGLDLFRAITEVESVQKILADFRENADERFKSIFETAVGMAGRHGVQPSKPRVCSKQTTRANIECTDVETYYRIAVLIPFLDQFLQDLSCRFGKMQQQVALSSRLVPAVMNSCSTMTSSQLQELLQSYPDIESPLSFQSEYERWQWKWKNNEEEAKAVNGFEEAYLAADIDLFPGINLIMKISSTRPSSTAGNERAFSALKRLKTYMRSSMSADRLTGLALLHIHQDRPVKIDEVIEQFSKMGPHRLAFR
jgi:hypothetical protein